MVLVNGDLEEIRYAVRTPSKDSDRFGKFVLSTIILIDSTNIVSINANILLINANGLAFSTKTLVLDRGKVEYA